MCSEPHAELVEDLGHGVARTPGRDSQMAQPDTRVETAQPPKRFAGRPPKLGQRFGTVQADGAYAR